MSRRIPCPYGGWIDLPDRWYGEHASKRDIAAAKASEEKLPDTLRTFAVALALLDDWGGIEGLEGNPEKWNLEKVPWETIAWVSGIVWGEIAVLLQVPKNFSEPSPTGAAAV